MVFINYICIYSKNIGNKMNKKIAEKTVRVAQMSSMILDAQLRELKDVLDETEFKELSKRFAKPMGYIYYEILAPIWDEYSELLPDKLGDSYKINDEMYHEVQLLVKKYA